MGLQSVLGNNIRMFRNLRDKTQVDLAKAVGVSKQQIFRIEAGKSWPSALTVENIAKALSVEPFDFYVRRNHECKTNQHT